MLTLFNRKVQKKSCILDMKKIEIALENVCLDFPIYHYGAKSIKKNLAKVITGSKYQFDANHIIVRALRDITFSLNKGDRLGLMGPNGSGKSTLLRLLNGIYHPTTGTLTVSGTVGALIDLGAGIDQNATGWENIDLFLRYHGDGKAPDEGVKEKIGELSGLGDNLHMPVRNYSSGMGVRLTFAMETFFDPQILLMDEWFSAGDAEFMKYCELRLNTMVESADILVLASHNDSIIKKYCNKIFLLENGELKPS